MSNKLNIAFLGNFAHKKGSTIFKEVVTSLKDQHNWFVFGFVGDDQSYTEISPYLKTTVTYTEGQLEPLLMGNQIDLVLILSIWPETFSKTFFEALRAGVPALVFDLGYPSKALKAWPLTVKEELGSKGVIDLIAKLTKQDLKSIQNSKQIEAFFKQYNKIADRKYYLVNQLLTAKTSETAKGEK